MWFTGNIPSTIIDCTKSDFEIIRQGKGKYYFLIIFKFLTDKHKR